VEEQVVEQVEELVAEHDAMARDNEIHRWQDKIPVWDGETGHHRVQVACWQSMAARIKVVR
jgi:hypothetical protein